MIKVTRFPIKVLKQIVTTTTNSIEREVRHREKQRLCEITHEVISLQINSLSKVDTSRVGP